MSKENIQNYKKLNAIIVALLFICLGVSICYFAMGHSLDITIVILSIVNIVTCIVGLIYALYGYKKDVAKYFKAFMLFFCVSNLSQVIIDLITTKSMDFGSNISGVLRTVICVITLILTFAKDLGKSTSMGLAYTMLITGVVNVLRILVLYNNDLLLTIINIGDLLMIIIGFLFVIEKYIDKASRGAK